MGTHLAQIPIGRQQKGKQRSTAVACMVVPNLQNALNLGQNHLTRLCALTGHETRKIALRMFRLTFVVDGQPLKTIRGADQTPTHRAGLAHPRRSRIADLACNPMQAPVKATICDPAQTWSRTPHAQEP